jgi:5-methylcytosine-specific restriction endonuclease McrA
MAIEHRKEYLREYHRKWYQENKDRQRVAQREYKKAHPEKHRQFMLKAARKVRLGAVMLLGGRCVSCGCTDMRCLEIDHIIPVRNERMKSRYAFHQSIVRGNTENLQVLWACCHAIKTFKSNTDA